MATQSVQMKGVLQVGLVVPVQAIFALAALVGPVQNIFPSSRAGVLGRLSLGMCLWRVLRMKQSADGWAGVSSR
jgi:hypothetical protein